MNNHFNSYVLVDGLILAGMICPWVQQCGMACKACPGYDGKPKHIPFSCGAARLWSCFSQPTDVETGITSPSP